MSFKHRLAANNPSIINDIKRRAEYDMLSAYLRADEIAEIWAEGTEFSKEDYLRLIKEEIEDGKLACMTIGQWIAAMDENRTSTQGRQRFCLKRKGIPYHLLWER